MLHFSSTAGGGCVRPNLEGTRVETRCVGQGVMCVRWRDDEDDKGKEWERYVNG